MANRIVKCKICNIVMNIEGYPSTNDCGGDCVLCMAEAGDPDCMESVVKEFRSRRDSSYITAWSETQALTNGQ